MDRQLPERSRCNRPQEEEHLFAREGAVSARLNARPWEEQDNEVYQRLEDDV